MLQIVPAILAISEEEYAQKLEKINSNPALSKGWLQVDFVDNKFAPNKTITPEVVGKYQTMCQIEAQLMVEYPENWIDGLIEAGVNRVVFPVEDAEGIKVRVVHIKNHGIEVGLSLNPETDVEKLEPFLSTIDVVLVMSVHPGFGGQEFIKGSTKKVEEISILRSKYGANFKIGVDGGINESVAGGLAQAGADYLVVGSHLLEGDIDENLKKINRSVSGQL